MAAWSSSEYSFNLNIRLFYWTQCDCKVRTLLILKIKMKALIKGTVSVIWSVFLFKERHPRLTTVSFNLCLIIENREISVYISKMLCKSCKIGVYVNVQCELNTIDVWKIYFILCPTRFYKTQMCSRIASVIIRLPSLISQRFKEYHGESEV